MAEGRGRPKKVVESPVIQDSPIAPEYQEAAETGIFDPLAEAKGLKKTPVKKEIETSDEAPAEVERDIFDAIESGEVIPEKYWEPCEKCPYEYGAGVCKSCVEFAKAKEFKEAK